MKKKIKNASVIYTTHLSRFNKQEGEYSTVYVSEGGDVIINHCIGSNIVGTIKTKKSHALLINRRLSGALEGSK